MAAAMSTLLRSCHGRHGRTITSGHTGRDRKSGSTTKVTTKQVPRPTGRGPGRAVVQHHALPGSRSVHHPGSLSGVRTGGDRAPKTAAEGAGRYVPAPLRPASRPRERRTVHRPGEWTAS